MLVEVRLDNFSSKKKARNSNSCSVPNFGFKRICSLIVTRISAVRMFSKGNFALASLCRNNLELMDVVVTL